ncbi:DUF420 domain-containing protein [Sanyastnella coralliicola]|uniref:DUF420 domain-containing protein n=1 Tax=Sanyastnella coralliicola TaxID=3069118 RepID=UPI0027B9B58E|nr:DUF420 domain-containing protein [Longitalea sp. SCSIO 12813]
MNAPAFIQNERTARKFVIAISLVIPIVVTVLRYIPTPEFEEGTKSTLYFLPMLNALLNGSTFLLLIAALVAIKNKNVEAHRKLTTLGMTFSALFLVSYVIFHATTSHTPYGGEGTVKTIYYFILFSHIVLSAVIVPLVLFAFTHALAGRIDKHRKIVKYTFPLWLYVTLTGVIVYFMISPFYPFSPF